MAKISVQLLTWNGEPYIPYLIDSLKKQTFRDWSLFILDNASLDGTVPALEAALAGSGIPVSFEEGEENIGFAAGHNRLFLAGDSQYALLLNQDVYLEPDCIGRLASFLDARPDIAAVAPLLLKWNFLHMTVNAKEVAGDMENIFTDMVDSLGLRVFRNRRVVDAEEGEMWQRIRDRYAADAIPVFGVSAACALYRRSAVQSIAFSNGDVFDASYVSYKEDVDAAYRLRAGGYGAAVLPGAVAYHARGNGRTGGLSDAAARENKRTQREDVRRASYKNHLATIWKNEYWQNALLDLPFIAWYEGKKFAYAVLFDREVLGGLGDVWRHRAALSERRKLIVEKRKRGWKEMRKWWK